jgi:glycerophosphoryl diester phosphodiesterase
MLRLFTSTATTYSITKARMTLTTRTVLAGAWKRFRAVWPQLFVADLLARALGVAILFPAVGLLLQVFLSTTATGVLADAAILTFLLHPIGWLALGVVGSAWLAISFFETGQLMLIGASADGPDQLTWLDALYHSGRRFRDLLGLGGAALIRLILLALPFLAAVGGLYLLFLRQYDINYYLTAKPPGFMSVAAAAGVLLGVCGLLVTLRIAGWLLAIPLVLLEAKSGREALALSARLTTRHRWRLAAWLAAWLLATSLLVALVGGLTALAVDLLVPRSNSTALALLLSLGGLLLLSAGLNLVVSVASTTLLPLCILEIHRGLRGNGGGDPGLPRWELSRRGRLGWLAGKPALGLAVLLILFAGVGVYTILNSWDDPGDPVVIAHRGGAAVAPENTLAAFEQAVADGADWLELDVQEDADGVVVVTHDRDFMRVARSRVEVADATADHLAQIDAGSFFDPVFADERVPTLHQVLELARGRAGLFIELKYYGRQRALERRVVELVDAMDMAGDVVLMSLDYNGLQRAAALRPEWTHGLLNAVAVGDLTKLDVDFLAVNAKEASLPLIRRAHAKGMKVYAWTINDPVQMSVMLSRGVDGLITDRVALARQVIEVREQLSALGRFVLWLAGESGLIGSSEFSPSDEA